MVQRASLVRLQAQSGKGETLGRFLGAAVPLVRAEPATVAWFALRFGATELGIFDAFPDEEARKAHDSGPVCGALREVADDLLADPPRVDQVSVIASKLPEHPLPQPDTKGLLVRFKAKEGHEADVERFLRGAEALVQTEPRTTAWFALDFEDGEYGIFDVFPDNAARLTHVAGHIPRELARHALTWIGSVPEMELVNVLAEKLGDSATFSRDVELAAKT
jgi:quinol monooxygenase YgiN